MNLPDRGRRDRRLLDQPAQLSHQLGMASQGQVGLDADLERPRTKLVETLGVRTALRVQGHVREDRAVPEAECLLRDSRGTRSVAAGQRPGGLRHARLEVLRVENGPTQIDPVAGPPSLEDDPVR